MAAKATEPTSWTMPSTVVSAFLYLCALYRMTAHRITSMTELTIESTCEVPGAISKLCGPAPKNKTATTTVTAIMMPEPTSPTASRARSPRASSMPSAGTSGNRVRKYSSVIPSLPHAKTLNQQHVITQIGRCGGGFSVNWGVLDVQGKGSVRMGVSRLGGLIVAESPRAVAHGLLAMLEDAPRGSRANRDVAPARKMRPCGRTIPLATLPAWRAACVRAVYRPALPHRRRDTGGTKP